MDTGPAVLLVAPFVLALSIVEYGIAAWQGRSIHRGADTANDVANALGHFVVTALVGATPVLAYAWLDDLVPTGVRLDKPYLWVLTIIGIDFVYYWRHRAMHRVALLWVIHAVHHQANQFNFMVALRLGWLQTLTAWPLLFPLALIGVPVQALVILGLIDHLYQFLLHTEVVRKVPLLEGIIATPSGHRVHHACNAQYIDKNYAGMFAIWDRLFGTYEPEVEPVVFGTTTSIASWDPVENNLRPITDLFAKAFATRSLWRGLLVLLGPPSWDPETGEAPPSDPGPRIVPPGQGGWHVAVAGVAATIAVASFVGFAQAMEPGPRLLAGVALLVGLWGLGAMIRGGYRASTVNLAPARART